MDNAGLFPSELKAFCVAPTFLQLMNVNWHKWHSDIQLIRLTLNLRSVTAWTCFGGQSENSVKATLKILAFYTIYMYIAYVHTHIHIHIYDKTISSLKQLFSEWNFQNSSSCFFSNNVFWWILWAVHHLSFTARWFSSPWYQTVFTMAITLHSHIVSIEVKKKLK